MKKYLFVFGWFIGMLLQIIIAPLFFENFINKGWWIGQLIGLILYIIIVTIFSKKRREFVSSFFKNIDWSWDSLNEDFFELITVISYSIIDGLSYLWNLINDNSKKLGQVINKWLKS